MAKMETKKALTLLLLAGQVLGKLAVNELYIVMAEIFAVQTGQAGESEATVITALGQVGGADYTCDHARKKVQSI
jgi:hypothetical protein